MFEMLMFETVVLIIKLSPLLKYSLMSRGRKFVLMNNMLRHK